MKKLNVFKRIAASVLTALMLCLTIGEVALAEELPYICGEKIVNMHFII